MIGNTEGVWRKDEKERRAYS